HVLLRLVEGHGRPQGALSHRARVSAEGNARHPRTHGAQGLVVAHLPTGSGTQVPRGNRSRRDRPKYVGVVGDDLAAAAEQWQTEGWALVEGLVPEPDVDAVASDLERLYSEDTFDNYNRAAGFGDGSPEGRRFRATQFEGMRG